MKVSIDFKNKYIKRSKKSRREIIKLYGKYKYYSLVDLLNIIVGRETCAPLMKYTINKFFNEHERRSLNKIIVAVKFIKKIYRKLKKIDFNMAFHEMSKDNKYENYLYQLVKYLDK